MAPKGASTAINPIRLQTVSYLKVKHPNRAEANPCLGHMSAMLTCWTSSGAGSATCAAAEQLLKTCVDAPKAPNQGKSQINAHLSRIFPKISGPKRREGVFKKR